MITSRRGFLKELGLVTAGTALLPTRSAATPAPKAFHRVLSANIRVALPEDELKGLGWKQRKPVCLSIIKKQQADIVCFQEVLKIQAEDIKKAFPGFQLLGFDGPEMDAYSQGYHGIAKNPILFSTARYELLAAGAYWLSEAPLIAGSKSWNTARARHANWVRLRDRPTGKQLRVLSLHLDHVSAEAKLQQARLAVTESAQYQDDFPQLIAGDFNTRFSSPVFHAVRMAGWKESYESLHGQQEAGFTGHAFQGTRYDKGSQKGRIDYIWYKGPLHPVGSRIIKDAIGGVFPSDHFFISSDFIIQ